MADQPGRIEVEVAVAWPKLQVVVAVTLPEGATIADAIERSGIRKRFPDLEIAPERLGIFSALRKPGDLVRQGDRVEIYRPLKVDPKVARRMAAEARKRDT